MLNFDQQLMLPIARTFQILNASCRMIFLVVSSVVALSTLSPQNVYGQTNITAIEYFVDTDPGVGSGIPVAGFSAGTNIDIASFDVPTTSLAVGWHLLCMRAKNANDVWGFYECRPFYVITLGSLIVADPPVSNITALEYFFDTAPAPGSGTAIAVTPGTDVTIASLSIPTTSLSPGWHMLGVRAKNADGTWGNYEMRKLYVQPAPVPVTPTAPSPIVAFEYSIDSDPGMGNGTFSFAVTPATSIDIVDQDLDVGSLPEGNHKIIVRGKNQNNEWGFYEVRNFSVCNQEIPIINDASNITTNSFTANWQAAAGATSYQLDVSKDNFATFVTGYDNKTVTALSETVTGLTSAIAYQYRVRAVSSCASDYGSIVAATTLLGLPTAQPSGLNFSSTSNSVSVSFSAASGAPTGYLVIRKTGSSSTFVPANNTAYTQGQLLANGATVAYSGSATSFLDAALDPLTDYHYDIFSYNQSGALYSYLTSQVPLQGNKATMASEPAEQPSDIIFSAVTHETFTVSFSAPTLIPDGYLVLRSEGGTFPAAVPVDGTVYTTTVGSDDVVHNGPATTFNLSGLTQNTAYHFMVFAYNGSGASINYLAASPLQGSQLTPIASPMSPADLVFSNVTPVGMTLTWSAPTASPSGYLVIRKTGMSPAFAPEQNTFYTAGQILADGTVAYAGISTSFDDTGLTASTAYFYDVFAYNQNDLLISYQTVPPLEGSKTTFTAEPAAQSAAVMVTGITTTSATVSFTPADPPPSGYLLLRNTGSGPTTPPADGTIYTEGEALGDGTVVFVGAETNFTDNTLAPGSNYSWHVFSYNGEGATTNYLATVSSANSTSVTTVPGQPVLTDASAVAHDQFTIHWEPTTGAIDYRLDVSGDNFVTLITGFDDLAVSGTSATITALQSGTAYQYRLRAVNASGTSVNAEAVEQFTVPATPVLSASTEVGQTSFTVNWTDVTGATDYFIDVSADAAFTSFAPGYENVSCGDVTLIVVEGLAPGTAYHYRLRAANSGGVSSHSESKDQLLIPATPLALEAAPATTSFKASWEPVTGATGYEIDVTLSENDFNPALQDYNNRTVDEGLAEQLVVGLTPNTVYRYRVRALNAAGTSPSSTPVSVSTELQVTGLPLQLSTPVFSPVLTSMPADISVEVTGGTPPYSMAFYYRKITSNDFTTGTATQGTATTWQVVIDESMPDQMGLEFYFEVTDASEVPKVGARQFMYQPVPTAGIQIPFTTSGGTALSYEIFSIPYEVSDNLVASLFEAMGPIDKSKWRLVRYQGGKNIDLGTANRIEPGKAYWFNRKENIDVRFSSGTVLKRNQSEPFRLQLEKGWNQIGNPYPFDVDWNDILAANPDAQLIGNLKIYNPVGFHLNDESNILKTWSGGYVHNGGDQAVVIVLPVTLKNTAGGRKASGRMSASRLDQPEWFVPIAISQGKFVKHPFGFGMHPQASSSIDPYDDIVVPRFLNYLEFYVNHDDYFSPKFSRDIVPTSSSHTWNFTFESNSGNDLVTLEWDNEIFGMNDAELLLFDVSKDRIVNMRTTNRYEFTPEPGQAFKIIYGMNSSELSPDITLLGKAYPNPFGTTTTIPFIIEHDQSEVDIQIVDLMGRSIAQPVNATYSRGIHETAWDGKNYQGETVSSGVYLYRMEANGRTTTRRIIKY